MVENQLSKRDIFSWVHLKTNKTKPKPPSETPKKEWGTLFPVNLQSLSNGNIKKVFGNFFGHSKPVGFPQNHHFSLVSLNLLTLVFLLLFREQGTEIPSCDLFVSNSGQSCTSPLLWRAGQGWMGHKAKQKSWSLSHQSDGLSVSMSKAHLSATQISAMVHYLHVCW